MPSFPVNRRFCTAATCWISRITNSEEGVVQCAPMVNVPHSPLGLHFSSSYPLDHLVLYKYVSIIGCDTRTL